MTLIKITKDSVILLSKYPYEIELKRIPTPVALLSWVNHLTGKNWMGRDEIREFIRKICQVKGWNLPQL